jgi:hypothetical protein
MLTSADCSADLGARGPDFRNKKAAELPRRLLGDGMFDQHAFVALIALTTVRRAPEGGSICIHTLGIPGSCLSIEKRDPGV